MKIGGGDHVWEAREMERSHGGQSVGQHGECDVGWTCP